MQTIRISPLMEALNKLEGLVPIFDRGTTTKFIIAQVNTPYTIPASKIFLDRNFSLGKIQKKNIVKAKAIK